MMESATPMADDDPFQKIHSQLRNICTVGFNRMHVLWSEMFERNICLDYCERLPDHMMSFFEEVYEESFQRKQRFVEEIAQLKQEALNLQRLLGEQTPCLPPGTETKPLLEQRSTLDASLEKMRQALSKRHEIIDEYMLEMETLCEELSEEPKILSKDPLPTEHELTEFRSFLDHLMAEKMQRLDEIANLRRETKRLMGYLETVPLTDEQQRLLNARKFPPTRANMYGLRMLHEDTVAQYESLKQHIDDVRRKLERLWQCLETDPAVVRKFGKLTSYTQTTFDRLFAEHDRCETLRRENMKAFVERTRFEITEWWERCMKSADERARFSTFHSEEFNDDTLKLHELELASLKEFYHENEPIFQMVHQRQEMWDRMLALENKSNDPTRYNNRGGKLLDEEKERRRISCQLPKIEAKLLEACQRYEEENGRKFTVYGTPVQDVIEQQWKQREESKHQISSARKKANGLLGISTVGRTPGRGGESMIKSSSIRCNNRSRLVAGSGGSAMKAPVTPLIARSVTKSGPWLKRKLATPTNSTGTLNVKRSLLRELNSPVLANRTANGTKLTIAKAAPGKIPAIKVYDSKAGGSVAQKRRSRRKSQSKRRSVSLAKVPSVIVSSTEGSIMQESVCYEKIENFFDNNVPNRSSVVPEKLQARRITRLQHHRMAESLLKLPTTDSSFTEGEENIEPIASAPLPPMCTGAVGVPASFSHSPAASSTLLLRSPGVVGTSHSTSIAGNSTRLGAGSRRLKPATKNCPIIF
ncbi:protein regulator of cytokinesis 1-like [Anopheles maculipalpis]|uniref:protein regulator of cytokinesis 1-like n=1 Tax=Anopheles maculipalpis TaxID=1496333 RepID=UPI002158A6BC|nr:protein regulator of cytokinesis 1-like [Anopheles maculipalpis]